MLALKKAYIVPDFYVKNMIADVICSPSQIQDSQEIDVGTIIGGGDYNPW